MNTETMYKMYLDGFSLAEVGKSFGITRQSVYSRFKKKGLKMRAKNMKPFILVDGIKFTINRDGYYECTTIDRLMLHNYNYEKVNGKIPEGYEIHHVDFNKINNDPNNLMIVTPSEHTKIHAKNCKGSGMNKKVKCVETGEEFHSIKHLADVLGHHASNISRYYIDGRRKLNGLTYEKIN